MIAVEHQGIHKTENGWSVTCECGRTYIKRSKETAVKILRRGRCKKCTTFYRNRNDPKDVWKREDGRWCKKCSGCSIEQAYTRKCHATSSLMSDWKCKKCSSTCRNNTTGDKRRLYNKYSKSAANRGIPWEITIEEMFSHYSGKCALTGWDISIKYSEQTASLDRIDSNKGYEPSNIQWVHSMVNMAKNKYSESDFIRMCESVARTRCLSTYENSKTDTKQ